MSRAGAIQAEIEAEIAEIREAIQILPMERFLLILMGELLMITIQKDKDLVIAIKI